MFRIALVIGLAALLTVTQPGCPAPTPGDNTPVVQVVASGSISSGDAPLTVLFSGLNSSSANGGPYQFVWDFADGLTANGAEVTHAFGSPGLYTVRLTVTDGAGETGIGSVDIRARGVGAVAAISSNQSSGPAPLLVRFDGRGSSAPDDVIRDYFWDFGDGGSDRTPNPTHRFAAAGTYNVTLRVVAAGGADDSTSALIRVDVGSASLDFSSDDVATLPISDLGTGGTLERASLELWFRSGAGGGTLAALGTDSLVVSVDPAGEKIELSLAGAVTELDATNLSERWRHLAITYNADGIGATVYLDGTSIGTAAVSDPPAVDVSALRLGTDFSGAISDVRLWGTTRTTAQISSNRNRRLSGTETGLERYWPLRDGAGQFLDDFVSDDVGVRGMTTAEESTDPAWTTDAPPISG